MAHDIDTTARTSYICHGCGTQYAERLGPPPFCWVCTDDRQYVEWSGQAWTTHDELARRHSVRIAQDGELLGVGMAPQFAIPQRALYVQTDAGNILWDCISLVTPAAIAALERRGGVDMIAISHPHFYASMVEWSEAFGNVPIVLHEADREWVFRDAPQIEYWSGEQLRLSGSVTLHHCPGHFPGSTLLHWADGPHGRRIVLAGDTLHVSQDRRHVAFAHSVPNHVPLHPDQVIEIGRRLAGIEIDDVYGFTWGLNVIGDGRSSVDRSIERFLAAVGHSTRDHAARLVTTSADRVGSRLLHV